MVRGKEELVVQDGGGQAVGSWDAHQLTIEGFGGSKEGIRGQTAGSHDGGMELVPKGDRPQALRWVQWQMMWQGLHTAGGLWGRVMGVH